MKFKKKELFILFQNLEKLNDLEGIKFAYAISKNKKMLKDEIESLQEIIKPSKEIEEYERKRINLCEKYAEKDKNNKPIIEDNRYKFINDDKDKFEKDIKILMDENKELLEKQNKKNEEYLKLLEEDIEINLYKINKSDIPEKITPRQLDYIIDLIIEDK